MTERPVKLQSTSIVRSGSTTYVYRQVGAQRRECLVPEDQPDNLEFTFVVKSELASGREFYVNVQTRNRVWSLPDIATLAPMPELPKRVERGGGTVFHLSLSADGETLYAPQDLPVELQPGHCWIPRPDRVHQKYYFLNAATKEKVMFLPPTMELIERVRCMCQFYHVSQDDSSASNNNESSNNDPDAIKRYFEECVQQWAGREAQLLANMVLKYGPEPPRKSTVIDVMDAYAGNGIPRDEIDAVISCVEDHEPHEQLAALREAFGAPPRTLRQRILSMYHQYASDKLHQADEVMSQFGQRHWGELLENLVTKWGPEPAESTPTNLSSPRTPSTEARYRVMEQRVMTMLASYDPSNLHKVQEYLVTFRGREQELIETLIQRFGPEPTSHGSSKASFASSTPRSVSAQSVAPKSPNEREPSTSDVYRDRLIAFYRRYNPGKVSSVNETLRKYNGQEEFLMDQLVRKYGPEPVASTTTSTAAMDALMSPNHSFNPAALSNDAASAIVVDVRPLRERVSAMYLKYAPDQLSSLDQTLEVYHGDALELLKALTDAYGPEPTPEEAAGLQSPVLAPAQQPVSPPARGRKRSLSVINQTRQRVSALLSVHAPDEVTRIDHMLAEYEGREPELLAYLVKKYEEPTHHEGEDENDVAMSAEEYAEKARAENEAFIKKLETSQQTTEVATTPEAQRGGSAPRSTAPSLSPVVAPEFDASALDTSVTRSSQRHVAVTPAMLLPNTSGVGQLYALEKQLHSALDATERALRRNEVLHEENVRLTQTQRLLQRQCDEEVRAVRIELDEARSKAGRMQHEFSLERIQLKMLEEATVLKLKQETQDERNKYVQTHLDTVTERKQLDLFLLETKESLAQCDANNRALEMRIKRREAELEDARAEVKFLTIQLDHENCVDATTQTDSLHRSDSRFSVPRIDLHHHPSQSVAMTSPSQANDVASLRSTCETLERELEMMRAKHREAIVECDNAVKFIGILKAKKKKLEDRVALLELRELAIPDAPPSTVEVECRSLEAEVTFLQDQLAAADAENRKSKREIAELRSLLSLHMSGATPRYSASGGRRRP